MANQGSSPENGKEELCHRCKSIPATAFFRSGEPTHGSEWAEPYQLIEGSNAFEELKLSAAAGCGLCKLFQDALKLSIFDPDKEQRQPQHLKDGILLRRHRLDNIDITFGKSCCHRLDVRMVIHTEESRTKSIEPASYVTETESDSAANFALARSWLAECCKNHVSCQGPQEFELPSRLLDVAVSSRPGIIRLVSALDLPADARADYAALSHCWGSFRPLQTRKKNFSSHVQGIPGTRLPQTFLDAVRTTRELGLRYLWIDSLCIVQDDSTDIETECARMNTIFSNAVCTISASDARDCRDGLFRSRTLKPIQLIYESDGLEPKLTVTIQPTCSILWVQRLQGPLQRRAWVLQERHLSPRIIHYTKACLMWECRSAMASEDLPKMQVKPNVNASSLHDGYCTRFLDGGRSKLGAKETPSYLWNDKFHILHERWYTIVEDYSHRLLSHPEDRLPALSGFAAEWKRIKPDDEYFAGLWKSDIFKGLAWFPSSGIHVRDIMSRQSRSDATWPPSSRFKGIPSWSWAAFDGPVSHFGENWFDENFYDYDLRTEKGDQLASLSPCPLRLHHVTTTVEQLNPFGRVGKGEITLSSWSILVTLSESAVLPGEKGNLKTYRPHPDLESVQAGMVYFDHDPLYLPRVQVRFLQLGMGESIYAKHDCVCGLALLPMQIDDVTSDQDLHRRVGMFDIGDHSFWLLRREWKTVTII